MELFENLGIYPHVQKTLQFFLKEADILLAIFDSL